MLSSPGVRRCQRPEIRPNEKAPESALSAHSGASLGVVLPEPVLNLLDGENGLREALSAVYELRTVLAA